jgi:glycine/D-amino acid oxidase-like deaminating enzyme
MKVAIIGNGIAGILLAEQLISLKPTIISPSQTGNGPPTALVHPFPGRSLKAHPLLESAVKAAGDQYRQWAENFPDLCQERIMNRPIFERGGIRLLKSYHHFWTAEERKWADVRLLKYQDFRTELPFKTEIKECLSYSPSFSIDISELIRRRLRQLEQIGCQLIQGQVQKVIDQRVFLEKEQSMPFDHIILAVGSNWTQFFPKLSMVVEGGSLLSLPQLEIHQAYSINGIHFAPNSRSKAVMGSTRWQGKEPKSSVCKRELLDRSDKILLHPIDHSGSTIWRGKRCIYPVDRRPICGPIPKQPGVWTLAALGNKGLLWGPLCAKALAKRIMINEEVPIELSTRRLNGNWTSQMVK